MSTPLREHSLQIGLKLATEYFAPTEIVAMAGQAEQAGFDFVAFYVNELDAALRALTPSPTQ